jgi:hypothetical protein
VSKQDQALTIQPVGRECNGLFTIVTPELPIVRREGTSKKPTKRWLAKEADVTPLSIMPLCHAEGRIRARRFRDHFAML